MSASRSGEALDDAVLHESFIALCEQAPCGFVVMRPDGTIARVNQTVLAMLGFSRDDLVGARRFQDLLTTPGKLFYENQFAPLLRLQGRVDGVAFDLVRADGGRLAVLTSATQHLDAGGRPRAITSAILDATDRRAYERESQRARRAAEELAAVVNAASDAIVSAGPDGAIRTWNAGAARMFGWSHDEMIGRSLRLPLALEDESTWRALLAGLSRGEPDRRELRGCRADGQSIDLSASLTPHLGLLGELAGISAVILDIGERRRQERAREEFLAMAAHELRSPVAGIKAHAQLMQRRAKSKERGLDAIISQTDRLDRLINDVLLAAQAEADRLDLHREPLDLVEVAQVAIADLGLAVTMETPSEPVMVAADRQRLGQVFANLLTNAIKYSPVGGAVIVRVTSANDEARAAVIDHGVGIPAEALPHLFDRFYRVEGMRARASGLGLGLHVSQRIVAAHGGRIEVESEPGAGSAFTVVLPLLGGPVPSA